MYRAVFIVGQINLKLRSVEGCHFGFYCPGCEQLHIVPTGWKWNRDLDAPDVHPSVKHSGGKVGDVCHYHVRHGTIQYCTDCGHALAGKTIPIPDLPDWLRDDVGVEVYPFDGPADIKRRLSAKAPPKPRRPRSRRTAPRKPKNTKGSGPATARKPKPRGRR